MNIFDTLGLYIPSLNYTSTPTNLSGHNYFLLEVVLVILVSNAFLDINFFFPFIVDVLSFSLFAAKLHHSFPFLWTFFQTQSNVIRCNNNFLVACFISIFIVSKQFSADNFQVKAYHSKCTFLILYLSSTYHFACGLNNL